MNFESFVEARRLERAMAEHNAARLKRLGPLPEQLQGRRLLPHLIDALVTFVRTPRSAREASHDDGRGNRQPAHSG